MATNPASGGEEHELVSTLQQIDSALGGGEAGGAQAAPAGFNPCEEYAKIRDILPTIISLAKKLPFGVGKRIAAVLEKLKEILDALCPA